MSFIDKVFNWLGNGRYNATLPTLVNGQVGEFQLDSAGRLRVVQDGSGAIASAFSRSTAGEHRRIVKAAPGYLVEASGYNDEDVAMYWQLHDSATYPASGAIPLESWRVGAGESFDFKWNTPTQFASGIVWAASETRDTWSLVVRTSPKFRVVAAYI
jgi:hypothetical protein